MPADPISLHAPAAGLLGFGRWPVIHVLLHGIKTITIPILLLGVVAALPVSFLCPISIAWVYTLWALAGVCSAAIVALAILPPPKNIGNAGETGNIGTSDGSNGTQTTEHSTQTDSEVAPLRADMQVQSDAEWDIDVEFDRAQGAGELLPISPEMEAKIGALHLPPEKEITDNVRTVLDHCKIRDDEALRKYMRLALQVPLYQGDIGNCFAVSHLIRWQRDNPEIIFEMLSKLLLKGRCRIYGLYDIIFIYPNFRTINPSPGQLLDASFADSYERRENAVSISHCICGAVRSLIEAFRKIDAYLQSNEDPKLHAIYEKFISEHNSHLADDKFAPFESVKVRKALRYEAGVGYHSSDYSDCCRRTIIAADKLNDGNLWRKISSTYGLVDFVMYQFLAGRHRWHWDGARGGFCLDTPFEDLLKECRMPKILREFVMGQLRKQLRSKGSENDVVMPGSLPGVAVTFPTMMHKATTDVIFDTKDISNVLNHMLKLKREWNLSPGSLIPVEMPGHAANIYVPEFNSIDEIRIGQNIPFMRTNWIDCPIIHISKQEDGFIYIDLSEWLSDDSTVPRTIIQDPENDPMVREKFTRITLHHPHYMRPSFSDPNHMQPEHTGASP